MGSSPRGGWACRTGVAGDRRRDASRCDSHPLTKCRRGRAPALIEWRDRRAPPGAASSTTAVRGLDPTLGSLAPNQVNLTECLLSGVAKTHLIFPIRSGLADKPARISDPLARQPTAVLGCGDYASLRLDLGAGRRKFLWLYFKIARPVSDQTPTDDSSADLGGYETV